MKLKESPMVRSHENFKTIRDVATKQETLSLYCKQ